MPSTDRDALSFRRVVIDAQGPQDPHVKTVGDIDGDGSVDVVIASSNGGPLVWYQYPSWTRHVVAPSGRWSCDAKLVDMDGDGDLDILISEWYGHNRIEWYENPGPNGDPSAGPWRRHTIGSPRAHDIEVGDLDGDGQREIVTRTQGKDGDHIVIWKQSPDGTWAQRKIACPAGEGLAVGDIEGDGRLEIVIADRWYRAREDVLRGPWDEYVFNDWVSDAVVKLADMNGDGRLDAVLTRSEGLYRLSWFEAPVDPASGKWTEHVVDDSVDFAHSLEVCDLNKDGRLDIVTAEMHQSPRKRVMVYLNEGDALKWRRQVVAVTGSHKLCVADIGNTGRVDLIGVNWSGAYQPVEMWEQVSPENQGGGRCLLEPWGRPIWVVHGGGDWDGPENTLAALRKSAALGAKYAEIDLRVTKDGQVVLIHDETLDRTTNGKGRVKELTYAQIERLDAGSWRGPEFKGERVPLLSEALEFARTHDLRLLLHVKEPEACPPLFDLLKRHGMEDKARVYMRAVDAEVRKALDLRMGQYQGSLVQPWGYRRGPKIVLDALNDKTKGGALVGSYTCVLEAFSDMSTAPNPKPDE